MSNYLEFTNVFGQCGQPFATAPEITSWNSLNTDAATIGEIKVGLYNYDITCLREWCELINYKDDSKLSGSAGFSGHCGFIEARDLDGLAFGIHWNLDSFNSVANPYCAGFRNDDEGNRNGNIAVCFN